MKNLISGAGRVRGTVGDDVIHGSIGDDLLIGQEGSDIIVGGKGKDILYGGQQTQYLPAHTNGGHEDGYTTNPYPYYYGDRQSDTFVFNAGDSGVGSANRDVIRGFEVGVDKIDLSSMGPNLHFAIQKIGGNSLVKIDADHNGSYEMQIMVVFGTWTGAEHFSHSDFILA